MASVITIGNFDGVHLGHAALIRRAREAANAAGASSERVRVLVLAFDPHPASILRPGTEPVRLTTWEQRAELLRRAGADQAVRLEPTPELLSSSAEDFIQGLVDQYKPVAFVEGSDFRFGKGRAGDIDLLRSLGSRLGFWVHIVEPVTAVLDDHSIVPCSSTLVRWMIENGRVRDAAHILGRSYSVVGRVVQGQRRGRDLGIPTANISSPCLAPADGVYAGRARLADGRTFPAAISVGTNPQFDGRARSIEAHLLTGPPDRASGWSPLPGLPEYGWGIELEFMSYLRDQARYESIESLVEQIRRDCQRAASIAEVTA